MKENWKPITGYEGYYEVSDLGRVKSLNYKNKGEVGILKAKPDKGGFFKALIAKCCKHKNKTTGGYRWFYLKEFEEICFKWRITQHPFRLGLPYKH